MKTPMETRENRDLLLSIPPLCDCVQGIKTCQKHSGLINGEGSRPAWVREAMRKIAVEE